ncbi:MAG: HYR domain-containing protein, partial [Saprospiraceae bacterium]|nr:HYR domain-containing protein [Saprospiraceae bacterium]
MSSPRAQCPITVNAGDDILLCSPAPSVQLNGDISGDYYDFAWSPTTGMSNSKSLTPTVTVNQNREYVLTARKIISEINLVENGDFESGNTGFSTDYLYSPGDVSSQGTYDVSPGVVYPYSPPAFNCTDHSGSGNMLFVHADLIAGSETWCQVVPVTPNTDYFVSVWIMNMNTTFNLDMRVNGTTIGTFSYNAGPILPFCQWHQLAQVWNSGNNTTATLCFVRTPTYHAFYGLDDISFSPMCSVTDTVAIRVTNVVAAASPALVTLPCEGYVTTLSGQGSSTGPGIIHNWETADGHILSGQNTLNPTIDAPGTYTLTVTLEDALGPCTKTATVTMKPGEPLQPWIQDPGPLDCNNPTQNLLAQANLPGTKTYQWTAGPGGNIVSGTNQAVAKVDQPGEYTVLVTMALTGCTATASIQVGAENLPTAAVAPPDTLQALPDTIQLSGTVTPANANVHWSTPDGRIVSGANTLSPLISAPGTYVLTVTHPTTGCTATAVVVVAATNNCSISVDAGPDLLLCAPAPSVQLSGDISGDYYDFAWSPTTGMSNSKSLTPTVTVNQNMQYVLTGRRVISEINLVENGDFESGNTGFTTDYQYSPGDVTAQGTYDISTNVVFPYPLSLNCTDHSGSGSMLFAHADLVPGSETWCQTVPVTPNTDYYFSTWIQPTNHVVTLNLQINGVVVAAYAHNPGPNWQFCQWYQAAGIWNSGNNTTASLCIVRTPTYHAIYAIDDISFSPMCSATDTVAVRVTNVTATASPALFTIPCEGFVTTLSGQGSSTGPGITYNWETADGHILSGQNTLNPTIDAPGTYTLTVTLEDALGPCTKTATVTVKPGEPLQPWIQDPGPLDCNNPTQNLLAQANLPGTKTYQWTAGPGGNIVSGANQAVAKVDQPGEYTVLVTMALTGCTATASIQVGAENLPTAAVTPPDTLQALPDTIQLFGLATPVNAEVHWSTADGQIVSGANTSSPLVSAPGTYVLTVTHPTTGCTATASIVVVAEDSCPSGVFAGADDLVCQPGQSTQLSGAISATWYDAVWSPAQYLSDPSVLNPVATVAQNTEFILSARLYQPTRNLLVNGNFEAGGSGFSSDLMPNPTDLSLPGRYAVLPNAATADPVLPACGDHTSGAGNLLAARLPASPGAQHLWCQNVAVKPGTEYLLSAWALRLAGNPVLDLQINNTVLETLSLPPDSCVWHHWRSVWHSGMSTTAEVCIGADGGGALALDDLFFTPLCMERDTVLVLIADQPVVAVASTPGVLNCTVQTLALSAAGSSTGMYHWNTADGNIIAGAETPNPTVDAPGTYLLTVTDAANGCTATAETEVSEDVAAPQISVLLPAVLTCAVTTLALQGTNAAPSGSFSYLWTASNGGNIVSGGNTLKPEINAAGTYNLLATNTTNGCTAVAETQVDADGDEPDAALSVAGTLDCNFTPVNLTNTSNTDPALLDHNWTAPDGGTVNTGANPVLAAGQPGTYLLTLTNTQNGCTTTAEATVGQDDPVVADLITQSDATCFGASDGSLSVSGSGGDGVFTYLWDNGETNSSLFGLPAGTYTVTATDERGCTATGVFIINQPDILQPNAVATAITAPGGSDGTASANPAGGTGPYTFEWTGGSTSQTIIGLSAGNYTVTVTDANGCTAQQTVNVFGGACDLAAQTTSNDPACHGGTGGTATAIPGGGTSPFTFLWSNGQTGQTATGLGADTYTVVVSDANGCTVDADVTLSEPPLLTLNQGTVSDASCPDTPDGSATVIPGGGTGNIAITWSNGETGPTANALPAGPHTATATDENGCTTELTVTVTANDTEAPVLTGGPVTLPLGPAGVISLTLQNLGVTATDNCELAGDDIVPPNFDCLQLGTHTVTVTAYDAAGNSSSLNIQVKIVDDLAPQVTCPANIVQCADNRTVQYLAPVATDNCLMLGGFFELLEGLPSGSQFPTGTTFTTYTFTDASGNVGGCSFTVTILTPITVAVDELAHDVGGQGIGKILVSTAGSQPGYTYEWKRDGQTVATTEDLVGVNAGTYTLIVTDSKGCSTVAGPFVVDDLVSTGTPDWSKLVSVYPNPTAGWV